MTVTREMLLSELKELQRLTAFEQAIATVRRAQAASTPIAQELAANAGKAGERLALLGQAVRGVGGTPDIVGPVLSKLGALVQSQVNQVQTLQGALLGDLALEHQLRERARYARTLAVTLGETSVVPVLDRLDAAHTETIGWLEQRLAEVARTGTSALKATPVQAAVGQVRKVALAPFGYAVDSVNRVGGLVAKVTRRGAARLPDALQSAASSAGDAASSVAGTVEQAASTVEKGAERAATRVEDVAEQAATTVEDVAGQAASTVERGAQQVAETVEQGAEQVAETAEQAAEHAAEVTSEVLAASGGDDVEDDKAPFAGYDRVTGDSIIRHAADTEDVEELRTLLAYEQAHKARKGVLKAAQDRLTELSASV